jgi:transposase InsO family protein
MFMSNNNDNDNDMDKKTKERIALFRYGIVAPVVNGSVSNKMEYLRQMAEKEHDVPYWGRKCYKVETFRNWVKLYRRNGFDELMPKSREDKGTSRKIDDQLAQDIKDALDSFPFLSGSALHRLLISEGKIQLGGITEGTLRKFIRDNKLRQQAVDALKVRKKFEKEHINELWIADCMHGPYVKVKFDDGKHTRKHKVFLIAAIDDYSRVICARGWFWNENSISLEIVLKEGIGAFGLPLVIYCDNGSLFSSFHLQLACARLGIALIHSKPYDSPSRGKIERFFRTVRDKFLSMLDLEEIKDLEQLNQRFEQWLEKEYHKHPHNGINGERPMDRFMEDSKKTPNSMKRVSKEELNRAFQITLQRKVKNDSTVSVNGILYECPPEFIGKKIEIRYPADNPRDLTLYQDDKPLIRLKKTNPHENAYPPSWAIKFAKTKDKG